MIVGRETETEILKHALETSEAELIAVYGRRRVGKTYLIRHVYKDRLIFDFRACIIVQRMNSWSVLHLHCPHFQK